MITFRLADALPTRIVGAIMADRRCRTDSERWERMQNYLDALDSPAGTVSAGSNLVLRPHNQAYPVAVLPIEEWKRLADYIVGRVCHVGIET
jgi:hypothetical protein